MSIAFRWLWLATGSANLGDGMAMFVFPLLALAGGASPGEVAMVTVAATLAWPVFGLHAGWIVDQVDRRTILIAVNILRALVLAVLAVAAWLGSVPLWLILAAAVLLGVAESLVDTALTSIIPSLIPAERRGAANARIEATINVTNQLAGPPLAGLLVAVGYGVATGASSLLYLTAVVGAAGMTVQPRSPRHDDATAAPAGIGAGLAFLWRHRVLRPLTLITAAMNLVWGAWLAVFVVYAVSGDGLNLSATRYGLLLTAMAVGGLLASMMAERGRRAIGTPVMLAIDCVGTVLLVAPVAFGAPLWIVVTGAIVADAGSSFWRILVATIRQSLAPDALLGRVYSASRVISWGAGPLGAGAAGVVSEWYGLVAVFRVATVLAVVVLVWFVVFAIRGESGALSLPAPGSGAVSQAPVAE